MSAAAAASSSWPPSHGLHTPTVPAPQTTFTTSASARVSAPASLVFAILLDTSTYPSWCTFVPRVTIESQPPPVDSASQTLHVGTTFTYHVVMDSSKLNKEVATHLVVTDVSTPDKPSEYIDRDTLEKDGSFEADLAKVYRVAWKGNGGFFAGGLRTERFHEIVVLADEECEVRTWENMGGMLARTVKWMYKDTLSTKFDEWCQDLKKISEARYSEEKGKQAE